MQGVDGEAASRAGLQIGEWAVAPDLNQIRRGSSVVRLEPKAMAVLLHLARCRGGVASRDELMASVWPRVIVGDNALTQVIIKLRRALGDTAHEPRYIEAISKKGYRLIAPVVSAAAEESAGEPDGKSAGERPGLLPPERSSAAPSRSGQQRTARRFLRPEWVALLIVVLAGGTIFALHERETRPGQGVEASAASLPADALPGDSVPGGALPVVRVEPFEATGKDPQLVLISRGITADLVTDLSKVSGLWVATGPAQAPSNSSGKSLRARYVLSGAVLGYGERLRVYAELTDVETGRQLWSQRFDRDPNALFAVQDDLTRNILAVLQIKVSEAETLRLARRYTRNLDAYEDFLHAQAALLVRSRVQNQEARKLYWKAIGADAAFARAYAGVAMTYALEYQMGWATDGAAALARALDLARTAEQMSPDLAETHWVLGFVQAQRREDDEALRQLDAAVRLNPSFADAYALAGGIRTYQGRPRDAVPLLRTALRLNPQAGSLYFLLLGRAYYFLGDHEQAQVNLEQTLQRNPENLEAHIYLVAEYSMQGKLDEARWEVSEIRALEPGFDLNRWLTSYPLADAARRDQLQKALRAAEL